MAKRERRSPDGDPHVARRDEPGRSASDDLAPLSKQDVLVRAKPHAAPGERDRGDRPLH